MRIVFLLAMAVIVLSSIPLLQSGASSETRRDAAFPAPGASDTSHGPAARSLSHLVHKIAPAARH